MGQILPSLELDVSGALHECFHLLEHQVNFMTVGLILFLWVVMRIKQYKICEESVIK